MSDIKDLPLDVRFRIMDYLYNRFEYDFNSCYVCGLTLCLANRRITAIDDSFDWFYMYEFCSDYCFELEKKERTIYRDTALGVIKY